MLSRGGEDCSVGCEAAKEIARCAIQIATLYGAHGGEDSLRPLKCLRDLCQVSDLPANILGRIVLEGILMLLAYIYLAERGGVHVAKE